MDDLQPIYESAGGAQQLDPLFLQAQAIVESRQNPRAVSPKGAIGVSQFMPGTAAKAGVGQTPINPIDPQQAIPAQAAMMNGLISKYSPEVGPPDVNTALMEYHGGPDRSQWGSLTHEYPAKVAQAYLQLQKQQKANPVAASPTPAFDAMMSETAEPSDKPPKTPFEAYHSRAFDALMAETEPASERGSVGSQEFGPEPANRPSDNPGVTPGPVSAPAPTSAQSNIKNALTSAWEAARKGYANGPTVLSPPIQTIVDAGAASPGLESKILPGITHGINAGLGFLNGGYTGAQELVRQGFNPIGQAITGQTGLGNDLAAAMDIAPAIHFPVPIMESLSPKGVGSVPLSSKAQGNLLSSDFKQRPFVADPESAGVKPGATSPTGYPLNVDGSSTPTANPAASGTMKFAEMIRNNMGSAVLGQMVGGVPGAMIGPVLQHVATKYGPATASAVWQVLKTTTMENPLAVVGSGNRLTQRPANALQGF